MIKLKLIAALWVLSSLSGFAQSQERVLYKQIDTTALYLDVYYPPAYDSSAAYPAMVSFFGGGWNEGSVKQFEPHAQYFADRGIVCFLADYRVNKRQRTSPFESLKDAKSAIRFIRAQAQAYGIDTAKIVAAGGSAGGHLAAATAVVEGYNEDSDDLSVSCVPNALVLFNPVIDNGPGGYGYERIGKAYKDFSPLHNVTAGAPPTIILLGTKDHLIPVVTAEYYQTVMEKVGSQCELVLYDGEEHGFFNYKNRDNYRKTVLATDKFLQSLGYLKGNSPKTIE